ncbi:MAG: hypothetical protein WAU01_15480 [Saprospiraceae bacterium]
MKKFNKFVLPMVLGLFLLNISVAQKKISSAIVKGASLDAALNKKMTSFQPSVHGLKFVNNFQSEVSFAGINGPRFGGLCGGMAYTMLDYYFSGTQLPQQTFRPATGSTLHQYIFNRQNTSVAENADKWLELINNPFGWRTTEFFNWGLQGFNGGRLEELKSQIDAGKPVPLGLFQAGDGGVRPHHQVVAFGYQVGRYKGDLGNFKEDFKIFICDPNYPNQTMTLVASPAENTYYYLEDKACKWMTYFVDKKYRVSNPPTAPAQSNVGSTLVKTLLLEITTGGDDLRGGSDNVNAIVKYTDGTSQSFNNINKSARWINNYTETVPIELSAAVLINKIKSITLKTTFGGGLGGDNWNMEMLRILAKSTAGESEIYNKQGKPLVRFDGNNQPFEAVIK